MVMTIREIVRMVLHLIVEVDTTNTAQQMKDISPFIILEFSRIQ